MQRESFLILFNIAKESSIGHLIRTANIFGTRVIVVGKRNFGRGGATGRAQRTSVNRFYELTDAVEFIKERGCKLIGVEIDSGATSIREIKFESSVAFMVGNEGAGLSQRQVAMCDELVYVPQFGTARSANVNVATGIVLHHFAHQAGYTPCDLSGNKFKSRPDRVEPRRGPIDIV